MPEESGADETTLIPGYLYAYCGATRLEPEVFSDLYHGARAELEQAFIASKGLPFRGNDLDLARHAECPAGYDPEKSAFRGTVPFPAYPGFYSGATHWAGKGGLVFHICMWRGYDLSRLDGVIPAPTGFRSLHFKEVEVSIPARVPRKYIKVIGDVIENHSGQLKPVWRR